MHIVDHVFILLLLAVQPAYGAYEARCIRADAEAGKPLDRVDWYRSTTILEWAFLAVLLGAWFYYGRPLSDLGFVTPGGQGFWLGAIFVVLVVGYLLYAHQRVKQMDESEREKNIEAIGDVAIYLPRTNRDLKYFTAVSVTAGIVEEIVYRGFVIWYLSLFVPLWPAVFVSAIVFGLAHSYQGPGGALRCGSLGLGFGVFYVLTGSIWLPMLAHFLMDALQGLSLRELLSDSEAPQPQST